MKYATVILALLLICTFSNAAEKSYTVEASFSLPCAHEKTLNDYDLMNPGGITLDKLNLQIVTVPQFDSSLGTLKRVKLETPDVSLKSKAIWTAETQIVDVGATTKLKVAYPGYDAKAQCTYHSPGIFQYINGTFVEYGLDLSSLVTSTINARSEYIGTGNVDIPVQVHNFTTMGCVAGGVIGRPYRILWSFVETKATGTVRVTYIYE